jgi:hypothetical protein
MLLLKWGINNQPQGKKNPNDMDTLLARGQVRQLGNGDRKLENQKAEVAHNY